MDVGGKPAPIARVLGVRVNLVGTERTLTVLYGQPRSLIGHVIDARGVCRQKLRHRHRAVVERKQQELRDVRAKDIAGGKAAEEIFGVTGFGP